MTTHVLLHLSCLLQGKYDEAEQLYKCLLAIDENNSGPDNSDVAKGLHNWAMLLEKEVRVQGMLPAYTSASIDPR